MADKLDLNLPERKNPRTPPALKTTIVINLLTLIIVSVMLAVMLFKNPHGMETQEGTALSGDDQKQLALKLEEQGINHMAAAAWQDYLSVSRPKADEAAKIWYRIGTLYQDGRQYDKALAAYYRSEDFARIPDLAPEISRRVQESLESMGKFAALRDELAERVKVTGAKSASSASSDRSAVVAEIGSEKITLSDLDHQIEKIIGRQIAMMSPYMPEEARNQQKEALFKQFSTTKQRELFLNRYLAEELLYRDARASNLLDNPDVQAEIKDQERAILAQRDIEQTYEKNIKVTDGDLKTYYDAHKGDYMVPERVKISRILVKDAAAAQIVRSELQEGKDFAQVARAESMDAASAEKGGKLDQWIEKRPKTIVPGLDDNPEAVDLIFETGAGKLVAENIPVQNGTYIVRVDEKMPEHQKTFDEVKSNVYGALRAQKEREVRERLLKNLRDKYDVVIHASALGAEPGLDQQKQASSETSKTQ